MRALKGFAKWFAFTFLPWVIVPLVTYSIGLTFGKARAWDELKEAIATPQGDRHPKGGDGEAAPSRSDESAGPAATQDAPNNAQPIEDTPQTTPTNPIEEAA